MAEGARYREWLDTCRMARHAAWVMNGSGMLKHQVSAEDLAGCWMSGHVVSKREAYEMVKERIKSRRKDVE